MPYIYLTILQCRWTKPEPHTIYTYDTLNARFSTKVYVLLSVAMCMLSILHEYHTGRSSTIPKLCLVKGQCSQAVQIEGSFIYYDQLIHSCPAGYVATNTVSSQGH